MGHSHSHNHGNSHHEHGHYVNKKVLFISFLLICSFMIVELVGGFLTIA